MAVKIESVICKECARRAGNFCTLGIVAVNDECPRFRKQNENLAQLIVAVHDLTQQIKKFNLLASKNVEWEYDQSRVAEYGKIEDIAAYLDHQAAEGWELVSVCDGIAYWKREKQPH